MSAKREVLAAGSRESRAERASAGPCLGESTAPDTLTPRDLAMLRESEARFRQLFEMSSDWYWEQGPDLRFTMVSGGVTNKGNFRISNAIGKLRWELPVDPTYTDWPAHQATLAAHLPFSGLEYKIVTDDGSWRYFNASGEPLFSAEGDFLGYRGVANEITSRKRHEDALHRFRVAMDTSADAILLAERASMRLIDANTTACEMLQYTREALLSLHPSAILQVSPDEVERSYDELITAGSNATTAHAVTRLRRRDGSTVPVEVSRRAIDSGEGWMIVGIARDISARLAAEELIRRHVLQQRLLADFGLHALADDSRASLVQNVADFVAQGLEVEFSAVLLKADGGPTLTLTAGVGWQPAWLGRSVLPQPAPATTAQLFNMDGPFVASERSGDDPLSRHPLVQAHAIRSAVSVPITGLAGVYGVLCAASPEPDRLTIASVSFVQSMANALATTLDRKQAHERLSKLAQFDTLTGLANRSLFLDRFGQMLKQSARDRCQAGVLFLDLDRFKLVNDTLGHAAGDSLLVLVGERLKRCLRPTDSVGRLGGDEFAFLLPRLQSPESAAQVAQRVVDSFSSPFTIEGQELYVSASVGISLYPGDGDDPGTLLRNADTAMYSAKEKGRDGFHFYQPAMNEQSRQRLQLQTALRGALDRHEFILHYQPKACLQSGAISGFEALLRWQHPERGLVPPLEFISILEETGLILPVGEWVVRSVCEQLMAWQRDGLSPRPVAINLSARQFHRGDLDQTIARIIAETGVNPAWLEFELTESMLMSDPDQAGRMLQNLRACGVRLSIDDFGTGYSSLSYLRRFPLDALKIDRAFIRDVTTNESDASIALAIIQLAHSLKLKVIAEGVETLAQLTFLRAQGCDEMQGYLFARPQPLLECTRALTEGWQLPPPPVAAPHLS